MLFNSHVFIFLFLPIIFIGFRVLSRYAPLDVAIAWLVVGSLVFYGWWNPAYLWLILGSIGFNYGVGEWMGRRARAHRRPLLVIGVVGNLSVLGYFKYYGFFLDTVATLSGGDLVAENILLPLAISFFTFQQITYLVDLYQDKVEDHNFLHYMLFVIFFPQLIAGPIVHHTEILPQIKQARFMTFYWGDLAKGLAVFSIGLFKKVGIADQVALYSTPIFDAAATGTAPALVEAWMAAIAYTFQIYFDFSGYSDMAIGLALMFGVVLPLNFDSPYKASSIIDFWRRWHMTLSRFLRDYLYFPLGGGRGGNARHLRNVMLVMLLGGLWHGAGWTFIVWGGLHGLYIVINHGWRQVRPGETGIVEAYMGRSLTLLAVIVAWVVFRAGDWNAATSMLSGMAGLNGVTLNYTHFAPLNAVWPIADWLAANGVRFDIIPVFSGRNQVALYAALLVMVWFLPNTQQIVSLHRGRKLQSAPKVYTRRHWWGWQPSAVWGIAMAALFLAGVYSLGGTSEFLYFQF
ncbi:MAG: MBOAT family O-acyltransferase [Alphaproteobacteria bacterium]